MSDFAIRVVGLSKRFSIEKLNSRKALRVLLEDAMRAPFRRFSSTVRQVIHNQSGQQSKNDRYIWALKDISFEVKRGEMVGIIGYNGAGKSVLLKVLSRVTKPTEGYAKIYGNVGSMLEVGTGFHPELTGRENIYLSGTILGMRKAEIKRKFDEIVAFSESEKFLDTPVKRYSSGMDVRLAFAIAAHLEPEIILMDEVLAVGDDAFREKCQNKMKKVVSEGRTVLFVSHDMKSVERLCDRVIHLSEGKIALIGDTHKVVSHYISKGQK